jgi:voltage-gated potassium channel
MADTKSKTKRSRRIPRSFWERAVYSIGVIAAMVLLGSLAIHYIEGWSYVDSFYYTSFIATGQGPPANLEPSTTVAKIFSSILAFMSVGTVVTALLFLFGPFLGTVLRLGEEKVEEIGKDVERKVEKREESRRGE